jgi:hypothetical protein
MLLPPRERQSALAQSNWSRSATLIEPWRRHSAVTKAL